MSITLGVYDLFAFTIPGLLYLYIVNEYLKAFNLPFVDLQQVNGFLPAVFVIAIGYVLAQILELPARKWRKFLQKEDVAEIAIAKLKANHPNAKLTFAPHDWAFLSGFIRRHHSESSNAIDRISAITIMLQNISFGCLLYALFQVISFFMNSYAFVHLLIALIVLLIALLAKRRSQIYNQSYYDSIFELGLSHGSSVDKIIKKSQSAKTDS